MSEIDGDARERTKCRCESCKPENPDERSTEQFRHECETRHVAGLASNGERKRYMVGVAEKRGTAAADRLRRDVWAIVRESACE